MPPDRHTTIPNYSGPISVCFGDDPKLLNCEKAQPRKKRTNATQELQHEIVAVGRGGEVVARETLKAVKKTTTNRGTRTNK